MAGGGVRGRITGGEEAKESRPEDLKSSRKRAGSYAGGSNSELELEPPGNEGTMCGDKMHNWGLEAAAMGQEGYCPTARSVRGWGGWGVLGKTSSRGAELCHKKAKGMFTEGAKWIGHLTCDRAQSGRAQAGGRGEQRGCWSLAEPRLQEWREVRGLLWQEGRCDTGSPQVWWRGRVSGDGQRAGLPGPHGCRGQSAFQTPRARLTLDSR